MRIAAVLCMAHLLLKLGKDALKPQLVAGRWRAPAVSARVAADLRKAFRQQSRQARCLCVTDARSSAWLRIAAPWQALNT